MSRLSRSTRLPVVIAAGMVFVSSCSLESPVSITDRPLAEQLEERTTDPASTPEFIATGETVAPETLAFSEALATGAFVRLHITADGVPAILRSGPGSAYEQLSEVPAGSEVFATGNQTGDWIHVMYADFDGWVTTRRISFADDVRDGEQIIAAADLDQTPVSYFVIGEAIGVNIRAEPNAESELVSGAAVGSEVVGTGNTEGAWVEVIFDGVTGWASGNYLEAAGTSTAPVTSTTIAGTLDGDE